MFWLKNRWPMVQSKADGHFLPGQKQRHSYQVSKLFMILLFLILWKNKWYRTNALLYSSLKKPGCTIWSEKKTPQHCTNFFHVHLPSRRSPVFPGVYVFLWMPSPITTVCVPLGKATVCHIHVCIRWLGLISPAKVDVDKVPAPLRDQPEAWLHWLFDCLCTKVTRYPRSFSQCHVITPTQSEEPTSG